MSYIAIWQSEMGSVSISHKWQLKSKLCKMIKSSETILNNSCSWIYESYEYFDWRAISLKYQKPKNKKSEWKLSAPNNKDV